MEDDPRSGASWFRRLELILLGAVFAETWIGRVLTRGLQKTPVFVKGVPQRLVPPTWFTALDYVAVFLLYFATTLGVVVLAQRAVELARGVGRGALAERIDRGVGLATAGGLVAAVALGVFEPGASRVALHAALALVAIHQVVRAWLRRGDLGASFGITLCALPILAVCLASVFAGHLWNEDQLLGGEARSELDRWGRTLVVLAAIGSPYCLAPRPFARSMTRILPFAIALFAAAIGAAMLRAGYLPTVRAINRVAGLDLRTDAPQDQMALFLLAFATVVWTTAACLTAPTAARRRVGVALALLVMTGIGFSWPMSYAVAGCALVYLGDAALVVRAAERATVGPVTPPIEDETWQGYVGHVVAALRKLTGDDRAVSAVSVRGEGDHTSTVILTERRSVPVRIRIERIARAVVVIDVVCGREVDASRAATWSVVGRTPGVMTGGHPEPPPAGAVIKTGDLSFDERFRSRGDRASLLALVDDGLRARAAASLDGWMAYWDGVSLRHRVFPGQGAPFDLPIPLSALSIERRSVPSSADRLVAMVELIVEIAARGLSGDDPPHALASPPVEPPGEPPTEPPEEAT